MMDLDDVLALMRERVDFFDDCGDMANNAGNTDKAQVMYAGAGQWADAIAAVTDLCARHEICMENCDSCDAQLREVLEGLATQ